MEDLKVLGVTGAEGEMSRMLKVVQSLNIKSYKGMVFPKPNPSLDTVRVRIYPCGTC